MLPGFATSSGAGGAAGPKGHATKGVLATPLGPCCCVHRRSEKDVTTPPTDGRAASFHLGCSRSTWPPGARASVAKEEDGAGMARSPSMIREGLGLLFPTRTAPAGATPGDPAAGSSPGAARTRPMLLLRAGAFRKIPWDPHSRLPIQASEGPGESERPSGTPSCGLLGKDGGPVLGKETEFASSNSA